MPYDLVFAFHSLSLSKTVSIKEKPSGFSEEYYLSSAAGIWVAKMFGWQNVTGIRSVKT